MPIAVAKSVPKSVPKQGQKQGQDNGNTRKDAKKKIVHYSIVTRIKDKECHKFHNKISLTLFGTNVQSHK